MRMRSAAHRKTRSLDRMSTTRAAAILFTLVLVTSLHTSCAQPQGNCSASPSAPPPLPPPRCTVQSHSQLTRLSSSSANSANLADVRPVHSVKHIEFSLLCGHINLCTHPPTHTHTRLFVRWQDLCGAASGCQHCSGLSPAAASAAVVAVVTCISMPRRRREALSAAAIRLSVCLSHPAPRRGHQSCADCGSVRART